MAWFQPTDNGWQCYRVDTQRPQDFLLVFANQMVVGHLDAVVYERFILEPNQAPKLAGSELEVVQTIGALRWIFDQARTNNAWPNYDPVLIGQTNKIKRPTRALLKNRGIKSLAKRAGQPGDHAQDAELHGFYYLIHTLELPVTQPPEV